MRTIKRSRQNKTRKTKKSKGGAFSRMFRKTKVHPNITSHANPLYKSPSMSPSLSKSKSPSITNASLSKSPNAPIKMHYTFQSYVFNVVYNPQSQNINNALTFRCKYVPPKIRKNFVNEMNTFKKIRGININHDQHIVVSISINNNSVLAMLGQIPSFKIKDGDLIFDEKYQEIGDNFSGKFSYN